MQFIKLSKFSVCYVFCKEEFTTVYTLFCTAVCNSECMLYFEGAIKSNRFIIYKPKKLRPDEAEEYYCGKMKLIALHWSAIHSLPAKHKSTGKTHLFMEDD